MATVVFVAIAAIVTIINNRIVVCLVMVIIQRFGRHRFFLGNAYHVAKEQVYQW